MIDIYSYHLLLILNNLVFVVIRIFLILYMLPVLGDIFIYFWLKFFLSFLLSLLIIPIIPFTKVMLLSYDGILVLMEQVCIGFFIGIFIQLIFFFIVYSGEIICIQTGLHNVNDFFCSIFNSTGVITKILNVFLFLLFLFYDGHVWLLHLIIRSFYIFPLYNHFFNTNIFIIVFKMLHISFVNGIILIFPIVLILFLMNILIGVMLRLSPYIADFLTGLSLFYFITIFFLFWTHTVFFYAIIFVLKKIVHVCDIIFY